MVYATLEDFELSFGARETAELSDLEDPTAEVTYSPAIDNALELATAEINGYMRAAGYNLPLQSVPSILRGLCLDIARYKLDINLGREEVRLRYKAAIDFLKGLVEGKTKLDIVPSGGDGGENYPLPRFGEGRSTVFSFETLGDY
jgi:phage gp36-like protein